MTITICVRLITIFELAKGKARSEEWNGAEGWKGGIGKRLKHFLALLMLANRPACGGGNALKWWDELFWRKLIRR